MTDAIVGTTTVQADVPAQAILVSPQKPPRTLMQQQETDPSLPARTTFEQDLTTAGQRAVNLIWETTQQKIALSVIWAALLVACVLAVGGSVLGKPDVQLAAVVFVFGVANLVTGFYFGRTNHTKTGGVGPNETGR